MFEQLKLRPGEKLILASASPRRAELLQKEGIPFVKCPVDFDEGSISAMGTEHPKGYDAFRKDCLTLLKKTVIRAEKQYDLQDSNTQKQ